MNNVLPSTSRDVNDWLRLTNLQISFVQVLGHFSEIMLFFFSTFDCLNLIYTGKEWLTKKL